MRSFSRFLLLALPFVSRVACAEPASQTKEVQPVYRNAHEAFQDLLNALPEESLHVALNSIAKFKDGVFESDRHGVEKVHRENPPLATKLIVAAVQDLKKRQAVPSNGTVATSAPPSQSQEESQTPQETPTTPAVVVPVEATTTDSNGQTTVVTSSILSKATASVAVEVTTTDAEGRTTVETTTKPAAVVVTTDSAGATVTTTSALEFQPTKGQVMTTTNAEGSTFLTTYTPSAGKVSSIELITTTGADGQPTVVTSYTYVDPAAATTGPAEASGTQSGRPGLQSGAAAMNRAMEAAVVGGAVGGAFALWI
jgi:hypothetical protein